VFIPLVNHGRCLPNLGATLTKYHRSPHCNERDPARPEPSRYRHARPNDTTERYTRCRTWLLPLTLLTVLTLVHAKTTAGADGAGGGYPTTLLWLIGYGLALILVLSWRIGQRVYAARDSRKDTPPVTEASPRLDFILNTIGEGLWDWDLKTDRVYYAPRWHALLGYTVGELSDRIDEWASRVHPKDLAACQTALERHRTGTTPDASCEHRLRCKDGSWRWMLYRARITERDANGTATRIMGTLNDITDRKLTERSLSYAVALETLVVGASRALMAAQPEAVEQVLERVLGATARQMDVERAGLYRLSSDRQWLTATHAWSAVDCQPRCVTAAPWPVVRLPRWMETLTHGEPVCIGAVETLPPAWELDRELLHEQGLTACLATPLRVGQRLAGCIAVETGRRPRDWRDCEVRTLRLLADLIGAALERRDLRHELTEGRQRLEAAALYDPLTRLPNRHLLVQRLREAMADALASGTELAVCSLDLDDFKPLNTIHGRAVGDQVLVAVAARLREQARAGDCVARPGGDEFVLLMSGFETPVECASVLNRLIKTLTEPYVVNGLELRVTASIGLTFYPWDAHDADTLLRHADHAMYRAKQRGRNCYYLFDPHRDRRAHARRSQLARIGEAINDGELVLYYQPKVNMRQGQVIGAEGLVRWRHPEKGLLPPGAFIPFLDGTEYQQRLDWWVIREGLRQLAAWHDQGMDLGLSLNISARSIQHDGFIHDLAEQLKAHPGLRPESLSLEILESEALVDLAAVARVIEHCAQLGVRFALDDFGTGYSSLTYFRRLPAQILKIDQTFVRDMLRSPDDRNIVEGVVGLAHAFRREVIAEGVESAAHGLLLLGMGCERAQGYGVAEPMPAAHFMPWVDSYRFPPLWRLDPVYAWPLEAQDLMNAESEQRDWVANLIRKAGAVTPARAPAPEDLRTGFGRWYEGEGGKRYSGLVEFLRLAPLQEALFEQGRALLGATQQGRTTEAEIGALIAARDRFIVGLQALQVRVLRQSD
jgi:diguanylate cyclase (GGDEF)-like protein/PAS domain S-box-containing protein